MGIWDMVYGFGAEFTGFRLGKDEIHMHSVVQRLWCRDFHWSGRDEEDWFVDIDGFDVAIGDSESGNAL
jgi:hypothetical protein